MVQIPRKDDMNYEESLRRQEGSHQITLPVHQQAQQEAVAVN
jgi:hypothetical protein